MMARPVIRNRLALAERNIRVDHCYDVCACCGRYCFVGNFDDFGMDVFVVFTDGACMGNGYERATAGVGVAWGVEDYQTWNSAFGGFLDSTTSSTNQRAELQAALNGIEALEDDLIQNPEAGQHPWSLVVATDSQYVTGSITEWMPM